MPIWARPVAVLGVLAGLAGCGSARGAWVREAETGASVSDEERPFDAASSHYLSDAAPKSGPQRLSRTITLGSIVDAGRAPARATPSPDSATATVQMNHSVQPPSYGYAEVPVFAPAPSAPSPASGSGASGVQPGQDFPAPASHGPAFPFQSSPASPWETGR
jgi:hypothetical protein